MDGVVRYNSNGKRKMVCISLDHTCSLKHKHLIKVLYDFEKNEYEIEKEQHLSPEKKAKIDQEVIKYCEEKVCYYCGKEVPRETLAGFIIDGGSCHKVRYPVGLNCLEDKEWIRYEDDFITLDDWLIDMDYKGDEELKDCKDLSGYPRVFEAEPEFFFIRPFDIKNQKDITDFDREIIAKFRKEIDLEWERDPGDVEIISESNSMEKLAYKLEQSKCEHEWYNSSASRQRCRFCYVLKK